MHIDKRDYSSYNGPSVPLFWRVAIGLCAASIALIIIKSVLQAFLAKRVRHNAATANNRSIHYNQQPSSNTNNNSPRNQLQNHEDTIEPLPVYMPPNNSMNKPPNYYNN
jgi:hypothetical protein